MILVECRECGSHLDAMAPSCPNCGALRPGVRFDAGTPAARRLVLTVRNAILTRVLTARGILAVAAVASIAVAVYLATRPTSGQIATRARALAADSVTRIKASLTGDLRRMQVAEEAYFQDYHRYASLAELTAAGARLSAGNTMAIDPAADGYTATVSNASHGGMIAPCSVQVGAGASSAIDGAFVCSPVRPSR